MSRVLILAFPFTCTGPNTVHGPGSASSRTLASRESRLTSTTPRTLAQAKPSSFRAANRVSLSATYLSSSKISPCRSFSCLSTLSPCSPSGSNPFTSMAAIRVGGPS